MDRLDAVSMAARWPQPAQRLANLDALRALASEYEDLCASEGNACTLAGLLTYLNSASERTWDGEDMVANDDQAYTEDDGAVVISTYHRSKGLEWPVVILSSLDSRPRNDAFGIHLESDEAEFSPDEPLRGRWIRYWPRPFGTSKTELLDWASNHPYGRKAVEEELEERVRLLYVGATRARDHLIFAVRSKAGWLDELADANGPLLSFDSEQAVVRAHSGENPTTVGCRCWKLEPAGEGAATAKRPEPRLFSAHGSPRSTAPPRRVTPSSAEESWPDVPRPNLANKVRLGEPLSLLKTRVDWATVGSAFHGFLACDDLDLDGEETRLRAERLLVGLGDDQALSPEVAILAAHRLNAFIDDRYPGATRYREVSIDAIVPTSVGDRRVSGTIDLLLETERGLILVDHKSFPDPTEHRLLEAASGYAGQLGAYAAALACAHDKPVTECWIHFPIGGLMVGGSP